VTFEVIWNRRALESLATIWLDFPDGRSEISTATDQIDALLQRNPLEEGESRWDDERILVAAPLVVNFKVDPTRPIVRVTHVRFLRPRRS
jgi:hypothetical protein